MTFQMNVYLRLIEFFRHVFQEAVITCRRIVHKYINLSAFRQRQRSVYKLFEI